VNIVETSLPEVLIFEPRVFGDDRGHFLETFRGSYFDDLGISVEFVQDNQSRSIKGTLRGLHFQHKFPQGKLVRVIAGEVFDVAVDLRESSATFGQWVGEILSSENHKQLWIPPGFAHGFYVLSECADLCYKCTDYYHPEDDYSLLWNDPDVSIEWPLLSSEPLLSAKDAEGKRLGEIPRFP
jgi:dTDP-4-dehydrorhamnose 3,5-epimerase